MSTENTHITALHPNHLGSTCYVTDENASVVQGFLYAPFGEITNEHDNSFGSSVLPKYSFNAKELDEETGMYYYEARYMAPPVFISRDRLFEKYPFMTPYGYCANNPVIIIDPSGDSCAVLIAKNGAKVAGHAAILVQDSKRDNKWFLYSKNGDDKSPSAYKGSIDDIGYGGKDGQGFNSVDEFINSTQENTVKHDGIGGQYYTEAFVLPTNSSQDAKIVSGMEQKLGEKYNLSTNNCIQAVVFALNNAGVKTPSWITGSGIALSLINPTTLFATLLIDYKCNTAVPNVIYPRIKSVNPQGQTLKPKIRW